ncbi:MAG: hypothetical protein HQK55_18845 [Deltaproteobacteria bacterium]|nr:hypothetical protein [Deltaproteobacteria bacterium]
MLDPFLSSEAMAPGLNLVLIKKIMETHQGSIEVVSDQEFGTTFTLSFPWERRRYIRNQRLDE